MKQFNHTYPYLYVFPKFHIYRAITLSVCFLMLSSTAIAQDQEATIEQDFEELVVQYEETGKIEQKKFRKFRQKYKDKVSSDELNLHVADLYRLNPNQRKDAKKIYKNLLKKPNLNEQNLIRVCDGLTQLCVVQDVANLANTDKLIDSVIRMPKSDKQARIMCAIAGGLLESFGNPGFVKGKCKRAKKLLNLAKDTMPELHDEEPFRMCELMLNVYERQNIKDLDQKINAVLDDFGGSESCVDTMTWVTEWLIENHMGYEGVSEKVDIYSEKVLAMNPDSEYVAIIKTLQARRQYEKGNFKAAKRIMDETLAMKELKPDEKLGLYIGIGEFYLYCGKRDLARECFEKVLEEDPGTDAKGMMIVNLAKESYLNGMKADAVASVENVLAESKADKNLHIETLFYVGDFYRDISNMYIDEDKEQYDVCIKKAIAVLEEMLMLYPEDDTSANASNLLASCYESQERYLDAINMYQNVIDDWYLDSQVPTCQLNIALCYEKLIENTNDIALIQTYKDNLNATYEKILQEFSGHHAHKIARQKLGIQAKGDIQ